MKILIIDDYKTWYVFGILELKDQYKKEGFNEIQIFVDGTMVQKITDITEVEFGYENAPETNKSKWVGKNRIHIGKAYKTNLINGTLVIYYERGKKAYGNFKENGEPLF